MQFRVHYKAGDITGAREMPAKTPEGARAAIIRGLIGEGFEPSSIVVRKVKVAG